MGGPTTSSLSCRFIYATLRRNAIISASGLTTQLYEPTLLVVQYPVPVGLIKVVVYIEIRVGTATHVS